MESGIELKAHTNKVAASYLAQMSEYREKIALKCAQYKIDVIDADINAGFDQILQGYLDQKTKDGLKELFDC
jgi:hypothetical protein